MLLMSYIMFFLTFVNTQVVTPIISLISIFVMDYLSRLQWSP